MQHHLVSLSPAMSVQRDLVWPIDLSPSICPVEIDYAQASSSMSSQHFHYECRRDTESA